MTLVQNGGESASCLYVHFHRSLHFMGHCEIYSIFIRFLTPFSFPIIPPASLLFSILFPIFYSVYSVLKSTERERWSHRDIGLLHIYHLSPLMIGCTILVDIVYLHT